MCVFNLKLSFNEGLRPTRNWYFCLVMQGIVVWWTIYWSVVMEFMYPSKKAFMLSLLCVVDIPAQKCCLKKHRTQQLHSSCGFVNHS